MNRIDQIAVLDLVVLILLTQQLLNFAQCPESRRYCTLSEMAKAYEVLTRLTCLLDRCVQMIQMVHAGFLKWFGNLHKIIDIRFISYYSYYVIFLSELRLRGFQETVS